MNRWVWLILIGFWLTAHVLWQPASRDKKPKSPEVAILGLKVRREADLIALQGRVKNLSPKPVQGVVLFFEFLEPGGRMITRKYITAVESELGPEEEGEFDAQTQSPPKAVKLRIDAEDTQGRYLRVEHAGPIPIEYAGSCAASFYRIFTAL